MAVRLWKCPHCGSEFPAVKTWVLCYRCGRMCHASGRLVACDGYNLKVLWPSWG